LTESQTVNPYDIDQASAALSSAIITLLSLDRLQARITSTKADFLAKWSL
jgi:hypothetical protein